MRLTANSRKEREKLFHNQAFLEGTRERTAKFYSSLTGSRAFFAMKIRAYGAGKRVLEYGCGPGSLALYLAANSAHVTGIDISEVAIVRAKERANEAGVENRTSFQVMDAESMAFPAESFDLVCGAGILHHLDLEKALSEVCHVLKADGVAIFAEPLGHNPFINLFRKLTPDLRTVDEHPLRKEDLENIKSYFKSAEFHYFDLFSLLAVPFRRYPGFKYILSGLEMIDQSLFALIPWVRKEAWKIVMTLSGPKEGPPLRVC